MIVKIIAKYLENHKRLVVPNLGTFIVKDAGHKILFSNLMKSDDGVLRALLVEHGVSELEAAGTIDRFVFEVNFRLDRDGVCGLDGFGALKRGANGVIAFITNPAAQGEVLDGGLQEHLAERQNVAPADEVKDELPKAQEQPADDVDEEDIVIKVVPRNAAPGRRSSALQEEEKLTVSTQKRPASYVKGLQYGRGGKIITGREYATSRKSSKGDIFIKIAIAVAVLAIMAILYGVWCDWQNMQYDEPEINSEETSLFDTESVEKGVENPDLQYTTPKQ
ncbi:MAG: hypothetical protein IIY05_03775 [Alistipes sp.]|nr:hypothetical protein [Alistipes sp.]